MAFVLLCWPMVAASADPDPDRRFPHSHITTDEWRSFFDEVRAKPGAKEIPVPEHPDIIRIEVPAEKAFYYFTNGGPAHPAVIIEHIVQMEAGLGLTQTGYFAGPEEPFARWFNAFRARTEMIREHIKSTHQSAAPEGPAAK
jgi:hypothetical protein